MKPAVDRLLNLNFSLILAGFGFYALLAGAFILDQSIKGFYLSAPPVEGTPSI